MSTVLSARKSRSKPMTRALRIRQDQVAHLLAAELYSCAAFARLHCLHPQAWLPGSPGLFPAWLCRKPKSQGGRGAIYGGRGMGGGPGDVVQGPVAK